jgi:hypothetical protein
VASLKDLPDQDLEDAIDTLVMSYEPVGKGNKPKAIGANVTTNAITDKQNVTTAIEGEVVTPAKEDVPPWEDQAAETILTAPTNEVQKCRQCGTEVPKDSTGGTYFCKKECQDLYYPPKKEVTTSKSFDQFIKKETK